MGTTYGVLYGMIGNIYGAVSWTTSDVVLFGLYLGGDVKFQLLCRSLSPPPATMGMISNPFTTLRIRMGEMGERAHPWHRTSERMFQKYKIEPKLLQNE